MLGASLDRCGRKLRPVGAEETSNINRIHREPFSLHNNETDSATIYVQSLVSTPNYSQALDY